MFIDCVNYIYDNIDVYLFLKDIVMYCNIFELYCFNFFVWYLSMNFKDYFISIKFVNVINLLFFIKYFIIIVFELVGFNSYINFVN